MELKKYQAFCSQGILKATLEREPIVGFALGLAGEAGEVIDDIKKKYFHGRDIDMQHTIEELGDVMWYVANIATQLHVSLDDVIERNVKKLSTRYPAAYKDAAEKKVPVLIGQILCSRCNKECKDDDGTIHYEESGPHIKATCAHCGAFLKFVSQKEKENKKDECPW